MNKLVGNAVVGQSGGPTSAINATLAGVIKGAAEMNQAGVINKIYGMRNGIEGLLSEMLVDLSPRMNDEGWLRSLAATPAAALGSCRRKLKSHTEDKETYEKLIEIFKKYDVRYFFYIGGNDSMDTVLKLSEYAKANSYELKVVGIPKTIDNDLKATDHTPGFGSAAKFVATTVKEILRDINVYTVKAVTIVEIMGRDAGWLTTASALPLLSGGVGPDLIYLPERVFDAEKFISDVKAALDRHPAVLVCASEGIRFADGEYVGSGSQSGAVDVFGHKYLSGTGKVLETMVKEQIGCKVRSLELSLPQRCAAHIASLADIEESLSVGAAGVRFAADGHTGVMTVMERDAGEEYSIKYGVMDIKDIANEIKTVPDEYINSDANGVTDLCLDYLKPLIMGEISPEYESGMPKHITI